ncbi:MAG: inositol monophosphatase family protein [Acaryochloris sp. RU_4_1]|nr:inositol monophosphatase family protein [Acaryochloris sp. SU_5_25]NJM66681.1 inositol monophosphatase family protein [Acaryochloris sp. RU_4_1]NJN39064.1 inositol monophosphatase family protein [Acaryochloridaceae cyanobacterium CSU_3_4]
MSPTPRQILETLFPPLQLAAAYARHIQSAIAARPEKTNQQNHFGAALSDADLSIQTLVEVVLLGAFPHIRFYGEEYEKTANTKYFRAIDLGPEGDYLVTLDPIDGTRFYLDGHPNYQIIVGVLNADDYEAVLAISPAQDRYYYALRGAGTYWGTLATELDQCQRLQIENPQPLIYLGWGLSDSLPEVGPAYKVVDLKTAYAVDVLAPNLNAILSGELSGAILESGKFIDGAALAFLAQEAGCLVTSLTGDPLPPLACDRTYKRPGFIVATSKAVHQDLLQAVAQTKLVSAT